MYRSGRVAVPRRIPSRSLRGVRRLMPVLGGTFLLALAGCGILYQEPTVSIVDVQLRSLGLTSGTADVHLDVQNPNRYGFEVRGFEYRLELEDPGVGGRWVPLAEGVSADTIPLPGRRTERVTVNVPFQYRGVETALRSILQGSAIQYRFLGDLKARGPRGEVDLPFESRGALEI